MVDEFGVRRLVAAIIEQAIHDRRLALTLNLIDEKGNPVKDLKSADSEIIASLHPFFFGGGLEAALELGGFNIDTNAIRRKSCERIEGRKKR